MSKRTSPLDEPNPVLEEHRQLMSVVSELESWLSPNAALDGTWPEGLSQRAGRAHERLRMHFAGDAEKEVFRDLSERAPHLLGKLSALAREHADILQQFRDVSDVARSVDAADRDAVRRLAAKARSAVAKLRRHEAEENEIISQSIWEDLGGSG